MWTARKPTTQTVVLVVDDEPEVRAFECDVLRQAGYSVLTAEDPIAALTTAEVAGPIDLVIADLNMPTMPGDEMAALLRRKRPELKVLFVTGHSDALFENQSTLWEDQAYLDKPFTPRGLVEAVSLLMSGRLQN